MSGLIGHTMYAMLGAKAADARGLSILPVLRRHWPSYLAGSYLGSDVQTMPEAICVDTGQEVGYGTAPLAKSPLTGGAVRPWKLKFQGEEYRPNQIHEMFYGRAHLVFGWGRAERELSVPWDHLADYCALVVEDTLDLFGPGERPLAYVFGMMVHVVSDSLIKSVRPGIDLQLLDGKYTPKNRPIQDLVTFHEVGRQELGLNWPALLADLVETPVEPAQLHYMRVAPPRGRLARDFKHGWLPDKQDLLRAVLAENRRYLKIHKDQILRDLELKRSGDGWECNDALREATGGLHYREMVELAEKAHFRHALWQMGEAVADLFTQVAERLPALRQRPADDGPTWQELTKRWRNV